MQNALFQENHVFLRVFCGRAGVGPVGGGVRGESSTNRNLWALARNSQACPHSEFGGPANRNLPDARSEFAGAPLGISHSEFGGIHLFFIDHHPPIFPARPPVRPKAGGFGGAAAPPTVSNLISEAGARGGGAKRTPVEAVIKRFQQTERVRQIPFREGGQIPIGVLADSEWRCPWIPIGGLVNSDWRIPSGGPDSDWQIPSR